MPQGIQIFRANGTLKMDITDRMARVLNIIQWNTSPYPESLWWTIPEAPVNGELWGMIIPLFNIDLISNDNWAGEGFALGVCRGDPTKPNQLLVTQTKQSNQPSLLVYGVY
jgi:hypothetical protein